MILISLFLLSPPSSSSVTEALQINPLTPYRRTFSKLLQISSTFTVNGDGNIPLGINNTITTTTPISNDFYQRRRISSLTVNTILPPGPGGSSLTSPPTTLRQRLSRFSNVASLLCVLDCTILPVITLALPLLGVVTYSQSQTKFLHELGHRVALGFVCPVGGLAAVMNYLSSSTTFSKRRRRMTAAGAMLGLMCVYMANAGHRAPLVSLLPHGVSHKLHCGGWVHKLVNLVGCALLLGSNYASSRGDDAEACCIMHDGTKGGGDDVFFSWSSNEK